MDNLWIVGDPEQCADKIRALYETTGGFGTLLSGTPSAHNINFDWNEPSKVVRVEVDQDRARALGVSSQALSQTINAVLSGTPVTQVRDDIYLIDVVVRAQDEDRLSIATLRTLQVPHPADRAAPPAR